MKCPVDGTDLQMADRQGVEIDYCPQCRGVWLDRGELAKIIERAAAVMPSAPVARPEDAVRPTDYRRPEQYQSPTRNDGPRHERELYDDDDDYRERYGDRTHKRQRRSFLDDIFDFA